MYKFDNLINEIVDNVKGMLTEALSERLFHFCPLNSMYSIAKTDSFKLSSVEKRPSDMKLTSLPTGNGERKQYNYYMCFSRTPSSLMGYVAMRRDKTAGFTWKQTLVRIEVDGTKLNANYKGMPVNYFNDKKLDKINHYTDLKGEKFKDSDGTEYQANIVNGNDGTKYTNAMKVNTLTTNGRIKRKILPRVTPHKEDKVNSVGRKRQLPSVDYGVIDRNQMLEYEDRLFSNKEYITNVKEMGYIKRIDIYLTPDTLKGLTASSNDAFYMIDEIINVFGDEIVHIYDNFTSFEGMNIVNSMNGYEFKKRFLEISKDEYNSTHDNLNADEIKLTNSEIKAIVRYVSILSFFGFSGNWVENTASNMEYFLNKIGIDPDYEYVRNCMNDFIRNIQDSGENFFRIQSSHLKKELEEIPPYKLKKYISKLEYFKERQENAYYMRTGKKINILSIKQNYCKY